MKFLRDTVLSARFWKGSPKYERRDSTLSVTVVIPAWNEEDFISATIESVLAQDYPVNVIVVNDRSSDRTQEIAESYENVFVINVEQKQGSKSQALNYAIPYVKTDIFICVDADSELEPNSVRNLMRAFNNENVMVASGFVVSKGTDTFWQCGRRGEYIVGQYVTKSAQENINSVFVASGCFFGIRTWFLAEHKFNDRTMAEDMDLTWVAVENGYDVTFVQNAFVHVNDPVDYKTYYNQVHRWFAGFFQNIKVRNYNLFKNSTKLGTVVYLYMLLSLLGWPTAVIFTLIGSMINPFLVLTFFGAAFIVLLLPALFYGMVNREKDFLRFPWYVFCMFLVSFVNYYIFVKAGYKELVKEEKLEVWIKGH